MKYFIISKEVETITPVSDGDDIYHYQTVVSVLTCNSKAEAEAICENINADLIRAIDIN